MLKVNHVVGFIADHRPTEFPVGDASIAGCGGIAWGLASPPRPFAAQSLAKY